MSKYLNFIIQHLVLRTKNLAPNTKEPRTMKFAINFLTAMLALTAVLAAVALIFYTLAQVAIHFGGLATIIALVVVLALLIAIIITESSQQ